MKAIVSLLFVLNFWFFIAVKVAGTAFAAWSWWWLFPGFNWVPTMKFNSNAW